MHYVLDERIEEDRILIHQPLPVDVHHPAMRLHNLYLLQTSHSHSVPNPSSLILVDIEYSAHALCSPLPSRWSIHLKTHYDLQLVFYLKSYPIACNKFRKSHTASY
ncbi:hypothetical protein D3C80_555200 [compost metagenome]